MRVRQDVEPGAGRKAHRAHLVEGDEGTDEAPSSSGKEAADGEASDVSSPRVVDDGDGAGGRVRARGSRRTFGSLHRAAFQSSWTERFVKAPSIHQPVIGKVARGGPSAAAPAATRRGA